MPEPEKTVKGTQQYLSLYLLQLLLFMSDNTKLTIENDTQDAVRAYFTPPITEEQKKTRGKKKQSDDARLKNSLPQRTHLFDIFRTKISYNANTAWNYWITVQNGQRKMIVYGLFPNDTNSAFFSNETYDYLAAFFDRYHSPKNRSKETKAAIADLRTLDIEPNLDTDAWDTEHMEVIHYLQSVQARMEELKAEKKLRQL